MALQSFKRCEHITPPWKAAVSRHERSQQYRGLSTGAIISCKSFQPRDAVISEGMKSS